MLTKPLVYPTPKSTRILTNVSGWVPRQCPDLANHDANTAVISDIRYKVLWIGKIAQHKAIGETKVLRNFSFIEIPVSKLEWAN